mgnify:CR=1 FL=1
MKPYQERVLIEQQELDVKLTRLNDFITSDSFCSVPTIEQDMMKDQLIAMQVYSRILADRIDGFNKQFNSETV